jgi:hypothetical protein
MSSYDCLQSMTHDWTGWHMEGDDFEASAFECRGTCVSPVREDGDARLSILSRTMFIKPFGIPDGQRLSMAMPTP